MRSRTGGKALLVGVVALAVLTACSETGRRGQPVERATPSVFASVLPAHGARYTTLTSAIAGFTLFQRPFTANAPVNRVLPASVSLGSLTGARASDLRGAGATTVNSTAWGVTVVQSRTSDPIVTVRQQDSGAAIATLHLPATTRAPGGSDRAVVVVAPNGYTADEFYKFARSGNGWTAKYVKVNDLRGTGAEQGARASDTSLLWGIIREADLRRGVIDHTLVLGIPNSALKAGFVPPANAQDGDASSAYSGAIPMGTLFAIPRDADLHRLRLSRQGTMLAVALQQYGAYVMRRSGNVALYAESAADQRRLAPLAADWRKLRDLLQPVRR